MQPLGLTGDELDAYHAFLQSPHDFKVEVAVLDMEERHVGHLDEEFLDGQVNIQRDGTVKRTATFSFHDPDGSLRLDSQSSFTAVFADRMVRANHIVNVPGVGRVVSTPFVGPVVKVSRAGEVLTVECQDKTLLAVEGCPPKTVKKGRNAVDAIEAIMRECTGERRFRFPRGHRARLSRSYSVGWKAEASPWTVCQKIARQINMQLVYACDGALMLRRDPKAHVVTLRERGALTGPPRTEYDITQVRNIVRVSGDRNKKKHIHIASVAKPKRSHEMSPESLGRHGVERYLPLLIDDSGIKKQSKAKERAESELRKALPLGVTTSVPSVPFFHLDYSDPVRVLSDYGSTTIPFVNGSLPLGRGGDAEVGSQKIVSNPRRR